MFEKYFTEDFYLKLAEDFVYQQFVLVLLALLLASLFKKFNQRLFQKYQDLIPYRWLRLSLEVLLFSLRPIITYVLVKAFQYALIQLEYKFALLAWSSDLFLLWFFYRIIQKIMELNLAEQQARFWSKKLLAPLIILTVLLSSFGLLETVINWKLQFANLDFNISLKSLFVGIFILFLFILSGKSLRRFFSQSILPEAGADPAVSHAVSTIVFYIITTLGVVVSLSAVGIDLSSLTVIVGGLSVGIGFGLQSIVSNFVSGFILLFEKSVAPGDVIQIGDLTGQVQTIGMRSITLLTRDHIELIIPNSHYLTEIVTNLTRSSKQVRLRIPVGVSYQAKPRDVEKALLEITEHNLLLKKPAPMVHFVDFADSSLNFELLVWTNKAELIPIISSELRFRIFEVLEKYKIEIPFPQQDIHIKSISKDASKELESSERG